MVHFVCPYCSAHQIITGPKFARGFDYIQLKDNEFGEFGITYNAISCANPQCSRNTINVQIVEFSQNINGKMAPQLGGKIFLSQRLLPVSAAKPQPDYIPQAIREDYTEACRIADLSPKAAATLARRCLQGMIRNFCGIAEKTLYHEIQKLKELVETEKAPKGVSSESVDAIDHVRGIGNIGAHMEANIDHIVPVEPDEAKLLIGLIESLFEEWYIERQKRAERYSVLKSIASQKSLLIEDCKGRGAISTESDE